MSTTTFAATATPSTTYPYTYTTFTNPSPSPFTTPTLIPSIFRWGSAESCRAESTASASASPSNAPLARPSSNRAGGCTISNEAGINDHAFWDLYACCESGNMSAMGSPLPCTAVCWADGAQSFLELGRCLSERVEVVVCSPPEEERGQEPEASSSGDTQTQTQTQTESASGSAGAEPTGSAFTGAASTVGGVHVGSTKAGLVVFGLVALGSAAGMFL